MLCPQCNTPIEENAAFCGSCGIQIAPPQIGELKTVIDKTTPDTLMDNDERVAAVSSRYGTPPHAAVQPSFLQKRPGGPVADTPGQRSTPPPFAPQPSTRTNISRRNVLLVLLLLVLIAGGTIGALLFVKNSTSSGPGAVTNNGTSAGSGVASGQVAFLDNQNGSPGHTDALKIAISGLSAPSSGSQYDAWLVNDANEQIMPLGTLVKNGQEFSLSYAGTPGRKHAVNLLGVGNKLEITLEQGQVNLPTGKVILSGVFPPKAVIHIRHLLLSFPTTPGKIGLLVGLLNQAQLLNGQALILQNVSSSGNTFTIQCAAQSIIDIIEGQNGSHYQPLGDFCALHNITKVGDGFGLLGQNGYVATASAHASLAATQPDSTKNIQIHAGHVEIAMTNIKGWVTTVDNDAIKLLANPSDTSVVSQMVSLSDHAYHGVDTNGDEQIDPVPGEAGAITAYIHGQLMAALPLAAV